MHVDYRIREVLDKIQEDDYLLSEAMEISDVDAFYDFCREIYGEDEEFVTFNEFFRVYDEFFDECESNPQIVKKLSDEILNEATGGKMNPKAKKLMAESLASITAFTSGIGMLPNNNNKVAASWFSDYTTNKPNSNKFTIVPPWEVEEVRRTLLPESFVEGYFLGIPKRGKNTSLDRIIDTILHNREYTNDLNTKLADNYDDNRNYNSDRDECDVVKCTVDTILDETYKYSSYSNVYVGGETIQPKAFLTKYIMKNALKYKEITDNYWFGDKDGSYLKDPNNWNEIILGTKDFGAKNDYGKFLSGMGNAIKDITSGDSNSVINSYKERIADTKRTALFQYFLHELKINFQDMDLDNTDNYDSSSSRKLRSDDKFREAIDKFGTITVNTGNFFSPKSIDTTPSQGGLSDVIKERMKLPSIFIENPGTRFMRKHPYVVMAGVSAIPMSLAFPQVRTLVTDVAKGAKVIGRKIIYSRKRMEEDPVKLNNLLVNSLQKKLVGQDEAIKKIANIITGMAEGWRSDGSEKGKKNKTGGCTMAWIGPSGVGKTFAVNALSETLFGTKMQPWQIVTSTAVKPTSVDPVTKATLTPADQLFNTNSQIYQQLQGNPNVVICIDEIDKMTASDPDSTILERLRDVRDTGKLLIRDKDRYKYLDVSHTVFVVVSNETRESWNLPAVELSEIEKKSRTVRSRDVSLTNRFDIVEFEFLKAPTYEVIAKREIEEMVKFYKKQYKIDVQFDDNFVKNLALACEKVNKGVRGVNDYINQIRGKLVEYRTKTSLFSDTSVKVNFDAEHNEVNIEVLEKGSDKK